ncbi:hypothetical protein QBZ16_003143 [Prototheca wickerhamii]|uniref:ATP-dependent RNA helicase n=1 Tax=Prototheca wickerhamii TaxID=3111 RepID=A0AAD9IKR2_PROWI|nr:hypothetical protein QBZ16_003143 [Prototheca wickerhamii]
MHDAHIQKGVQSFDKPPVPEDEYEDVRPPMPVDEAGAADTGPSTSGSAPVLPWMRLPVSFDGSSGGAFLEEQGFEVLFPVQKTVWEETAGGHSTRHDICIAAPTGSGKTLAYTLPMVSALAFERVHALRGLVVLPTRDLAVQVFQVLRPLCAAVGLAAGLVAGQASQAEEGALLAGAGPRPRASSSLEGHRAPGLAPLDVLVITPGRLAGHLGATPGFTLRALRFLIVDECDRLLQRQYQNWLSAEPLPTHRIVKVIASATLTKDPAKLLRLRLHAPRFLAQAVEGGKRYSLPANLTEFQLLAAADRKPRTLVALLRRLNAAGAKTLVFVSSVAAVAGVQRLLRALGEAFLGGRSAEYSGRLAPAERRAALAEFASGAARVLVCSDAMTRGMDLPGVSAVVNYDAPIFPKTYLHRAGRTARAGASGEVYTLVRPEEARFFRSVLLKVDNTNVKELKLDVEAYTSIAKPVADALQQLRLGEDLQRAAVAERKRARKGHEENKLRRIANVPLFSAVEA